MAEDIKERLKKASEECLRCYDLWSEDDKSEKNRECMQDAIHELRKVSSRLEIELAISERDQMAQKPIPIPPHRDARKRTNKTNKGGGDNKKDDNNNAQQNQNNDGPAVERKPTRRRTSKKAAGGES